MFYVLVVVIVFWIILTIIGQISIRALTKMRRWDPFGFLPSWHFFAPNPARFDTVIMQRTVDLVENRPSDWSVAKSVYNEHFLHSVFNPYRRIQKSFHDLQNALGNMSEQYSVAAICQSAPARALFQFVVQQQANTSNAISAINARQFAIVRIENTRVNAKGRVVFVSDVEPL